MSEPKFTKGKWKSYATVHEDLSGDCYTVFGVECVETRRVICVICGADSVEEMQGNAALIAAAPEMYNAEKDKIVHLQTLKNQICCLLAPKKDTVVTLDFILKYIDEIIGDTENLLAKTRGEVRE